MAEPKLNLKRPVAKVVGDPKCAYIQDGKMFDRLGKYVTNAPKAFVSKQKTIAERLKEQQIAEDSAKSRSKRVTGNLDSEAPAIPQELLDAQRENTAAAIAEEGVED